MIDDTLQISVSMVSSIDYTLNILESNSVLCTSLNASFNFQLSFQLPFTYVFQTYPVGLNSINTPFRYTSSAK